MVSDHNNRQAGLLILAKERIVGLDMGDQMLPIGLQLAMWSILALAADAMAAPRTIGQVS